MSKDVLLDINHFIRNLIFEIRHFLYLFMKFTKRVLKNGLTIVEVPSSDAESVV